MATEKIETEKKTLFLTRDSVATEYDTEKGLFGGEPDCILVWETESKPEQDDEGNWDCEYDHKYTDLAIVAGVLDVKFEKGICIKVQLEINRRKKPHEILKAALENSSVVAKDGAIRVALAIIKEYEGRKNDERLVNLCS